jgi:hypothetical protein
MSDNNTVRDPSFSKSGRTRRQDVDGGRAPNELRWLEERAAKSGMRVAVARVDGHWRAGFVSPDDLGEWVFGLHATGRDRATAIRRLAKLAAGGPGARRS